MTTAKPQPAGSEAEAPDDLIAELARLMAQDAQGDRARENRAADGEESSHDEPASPEAETAEEPEDQPFSFRLPADPEPDPDEDPPIPHFDFSEAEPEAEAEQDPARKEALAQYDPPGPFTFDFLPTRRDAQAAAEETGSVELDPADTESDEVEHDAIGDLIVAELAETSEEEADEEPAEPEDSFRIAPVFGFGDRPDTQAPEPDYQPFLDASERRSAGSDDPIDEIESLIGNAVRMQLEPEETRQPAAAPVVPVPSPALRSLATPVLPDQARPRAETRPAEGVEDAILEAAAATGAEVDWIEPEEEDGLEPEGVYEDEAFEPVPPRRRGFSRALIGPAVALGLLVVAGGALYFVLGFGGGDGPAPLLTADASPVKETPEPVERGGSQSVVFNEIAGTGTPASDEQIVSRDQSEVTEVAALPPDVSEEGLVNRKVRTVTVRPDGTIVGGEDALAGASMLPVDRPNVPDLPGGASAFSPLLASASGGIEQAPALSGDEIVAGAGELAAALETTAESVPDASVALAPSVAADALAEAAGALDPATPSPGATQLALLVPGETASVVDAAGNVIAGREAPVPMGRIERPSAPTPQMAVATAPVNAVVQTPAQPAAAAPASTAPAYVQLSSQRTEAAARQTAQEMQSRFGALFGGAGLEIQRVDLGAQGVYYRVRLPAQSAQSAAQICNSVKSNGGDCFTL